MLRVLLCFALVLAAVGCHHANPTAMKVVSGSKDVPIVDGRLGTMWVGKVEKDDGVDVWWRTTFLTSDGFRDALVVSLQDFGYLAASVERAQLYVTAKLVAVEPAPFLDVLLKEPWEILNEKVICTVAYTISRRTGGPYTVIQVRTEGRSGWDELILSAPFRKQWAHERSAKANIAKFLGDLSTVPLVAGGTVPPTGANATAASPAGSPPPAAGPR